MTNPASSPLASRCPGPLAACAMLLLLAAPAAKAQNPALPPPSQAEAALQQALRQNPALATQIRNRIAASGLTPEQVRARLQASGYPPNLLDAYLGGEQPGGAAAGLRVSTESPRRLSRR